MSNRGTQGEGGGAVGAVAEQEGEKNKTKNPSILFDRSIKHPAGASRKRETLRKETGSLAWGGKENQEKVCVSVHVV